ncbi:MAG: PilZ domain-containing protein [Myxococcota bacterium]
MALDPLGLDFDIDVDLGPLIGAGLGDIMVSSELYERAAPVLGRGIDQQERLEIELQDKIQRAHWYAAARARAERRRALRAPLLRRLRIDGHREGEDVYVCDISRDGLRASGRPYQGVLDLQLKVPGVPFPVETRAEVVDFKDANVLPIMNLRFTNLRRSTAERIDAYVHQRLNRP